MTTQTSGEHTLPSSNSSLEKSSGIWLWRERGPRKLVDVQGSPPPSSREVHPREQKVRPKCLQACMDEQGASGKIRAQKGSMQKVEARADNVGRKQRQSKHVGMRLGKQSSNRIEPGQGCQRQQEGFL